MTNWHWLLTDDLGFGRTFIRKTSRDVSLSLQFFVTDFNSIEFFTISAEEAVICTRVNVLPFSVKNLFFSDKSSIYFKNL